MAITEVVLGSLIAIVVTLIFDYKRLRDQRNRLREALLTEIDIIDSDLNWIWDNVQIYNDFEGFIEGDRELTYEYYPEGKEDYIQYFSDNPDRIETIPDLTRKRIESVMESHPIFDNNLSVIIY
ncbi:hypothetical protein [Natrinema sp. SYSU A 869]|uniref:hypothetical protein n=1 Tax=Natrinema sp. SYSU A 869 TaxID=2871694 RepID=UPI001CA40E81|nr:hypothetical protein [Natrinema sp. SYSU A 869]